MNKLIDTTMIVFIYLLMLLEKPNGYLLVWQIIRIFLQ